VGKREVEHGVIATLCYNKEKYADLPLNIKNAYKDKMTIFASCLGCSNIEFPKELLSKKTGQPLATGDEVD